MALKGYSSIVSVAVRTIRPAAHAAGAIDPKRPSAQQNDDRLLDEYRGLGSIPYRVEGLERLQQRGYVRIDTRTRSDGSSPKDYLVLTGRGMKAWRPAMQSH